MLIVADSKIPYLEGVFEPYADMRYLDPGEITPETVRDDIVLETALDAVAAEAKRLKMEVSGL